MRKIPSGNDLLRVSPELAAQWHPTRNGRMGPEQVTVYSNQHVWWQCAQGHEWRATVAARAFHGTKCPYCTGRRVLPGFSDLLTLEPEIAHQWHDDLNGDLTPDQVTVGSHKKVWWRCELGHEWRAVVYSRTGRDRNGCPHCANYKRKNKK